MHTVYPRGWYCGQRMEAVKKSSNGEKTAYYTAYIFTFLHEPSPWLLVDNLQGRNESVAMYYSYTGMKGCLAITEAIPETRVTTLRPGEVSEYWAISWWTRRCLRKIIVLTLSGWKLVLPDTRHISLTFHLHQQSACHQFYNACK